MRCERCGKYNPPDLHTCTPIAMRYVDELRRHGTVIDHVGCAAEIVRLYEENVRLTAAAGDKLSPTNDTVLLRQALEALEKGETALRFAAIAALRERLA